MSDSTYESTKGAVPVNRMSASLASWSVCLLVIEVPYFFAFVVLYAMALMGNSKLENVLLLTAPTIIAVLFSITALVMGNAGKSKYAAYATLLLGFPALVLLAYGINGQ